MEELRQRTWCPDKEDRWKLYDVKTVDLEEHKVHVIHPGNRKTCMFGSEEVHTWDPTHAEDLDDLSEMNNVHEAPLLDLLRRRYFSDKIYTFTGDILISINPYKAIDGLYKINDSREISRKDPHLYAVAARALDALELDPSEEQTIIINGESGAGKTEASKHVIRMLGHMSNADDEAFRAVHEQIIETNLVLEAFGNAKTLRNDNSSRFGKYIRLVYNKLGPDTFRLCGAHISYFLLETSRIVARSEKERNYHVLHALNFGTSDEERAKIGLRNDRDSYRFLKGDSLLSAEEESLVWVKLNASLASIGISETLLKDAFKTLAAVLELGDIEVHEEERASGPDGSMQNLSVASIAHDHEVLLRVAELLGVDKDALSNAFSGRVVVTNSARSSMQRVELSKEQARESINAAAKALYSRIFDWLLLQINLSLSFTSSSHLHYHDSITDVASCIGILDIYGFEILNHNSFEQLCINFANERLQRQFNSKVFDAEQERYLKEGVEWSIDEFGVDNQPCIDLIGANKLSIYSILDEQTLMLYHALGVSSGNKQASAQLVQEQLLRKLHTAFGDGKHENYIKPRIAGTSFKVKHFAGEVEYDVTAFPYKNTDSLHSDLIILFGASISEFVRKLFKKDTSLIEQVEDKRAAFAKKRQFMTNSTQRVNSELDKKLIKRRCFEGIELEGEEGQKKQQHHRASTMDVQNIFAPPSADNSMQVKQEQSTRAFAAKNTISAKFRGQLNQLMSILDNARPHYIRCIKPNADKKANQFEAKLVLEQLRYIGVMETVRIRKTGFPVCFKFSDFMQKFRQLLESPESDAETEQDLIRRTLEKHLEQDQWQVGLTCVFLKDHQNRVLDEAILALQQAKATRIQAYLRRKLEQERFKEAMLKKKAVTKLQAIMRMKKEKTKLLFIKQKRRTAAVAIQRAARSRFQAKQTAVAVKIQRVAKVFLAMLRARKAIVAVQIQRRVRGILSRKRNCNFKQSKTAAKRIQLALRAHRRNLNLEMQLSCLHGAARKGDIDELISVCEKAIKECWPVCGVRYRSEGFATLLHSAVRSCSVECVNYVLNIDEDGALVQGCYIMDAIEIHGNTTLHLAVALENNAEAISNVLIDYISQFGEFPLPEEMQRAAAQENTQKEDLLRETLEKRRQRKLFHKRVVHLDSSKGTLSYFKSKKQTKPQCAISLGSDFGTSLKISERYKNCFELHSQELVTEKCKTGCIYFRCKTQQELQKWISALRGVDGVTFTAALLALQRIGRTSWSQVLNFIMKENQKQQTAIHISSEKRLELTMWLLAMVSYQGPLSLSTFLETPDCDGLTARMHAEQGGSETVVSALDRLLHVVKEASGLSSAGRRSVTPRTLLTKAKSGGTFLSIHLGKLVLPDPDGLEDPVLAISVVNGFSHKQSALGETMESKPSAASVQGAAQATKTGGMVREQDVIEDTLFLEPVYMQRSKNFLSLYFGAMWHMQTPLEQLGTHANIVVQLRYGKDKKLVKSVLRLPFNPRTIGVGTLSPGPQVMYPAPASKKGPNALARAISTVAALNKKIPIGKPSSSASLKQDENQPPPESGLHEELFVKVHYSLRLEPCINCFQ